MNFYKKMEKKLNENDVYFGEGGQQRARLLNGDFQLGKVYKSKMIKLINLIIETADNVRDEAGEPIYIWAHFSKSWCDTDKFELLLVDDEGVAVFCYITILEGNFVQKRDLLKAFLNKVAKWDHNKI